MKPSIELTQEQLESIVNQAIQMDRSNRGDDFKDKAIRVAADDIHSSLYNTNRLFIKQGKELGTTVEEAQVHHGFGTRTSYGYIDLPLSGWVVRDMIRKLVLSAYLVKSNNHLPIDCREPAQRLYEQLTQEWLAEFEKTLERTGKRMEE